MLSSVLSRVNLTSQNFPLHLKTLSFELLNQSREFLESRLLDLEKLEEVSLIKCISFIFLVLKLKVVYDNHLRMINW